MTRRQVLAEIDKCEKNKTFDIHVDPIPKELIIKVTEKFHYPHMRTICEKIKYGLEKFFIVWPFTWYQNKFILKTKIIGKENLDGLTSAVIICNHVAKFDCLAVKYASRGHRTYTVAAPFNNMRGLLGEMMRAGDMLPMSETLHGQGNFNKAVEDVIVNKKQFVVMYPEAAMWWHYKKPRPYKIGAFHIAAKYGVPVVPEFITYRDSGNTDKEGLPVYYFTLHIMPPIMPIKSNTYAQNKQYLREKAFNTCKDIYEKTYNVKLNYESVNNKEDKVNA